MVGGTFVSTWMVHFLGNFPMLSNKSLFLDIMLSLVMWPGVVFAFVRHP